MTAPARPIVIGLLLGLVTPTIADEPSKTSARSNRLAKETSPYLLLHAHNPVDWYPWGPEAFAKAKAEDKPIFLSVGYSACYWCHVMERESFTDAAIAKILNDGFVCIKVDREERPDVDGLYMTALQAVSGSGGWPMSMFLLPDGRPFFGGTYFPPHEREGNPGFDDVLVTVSKAWRDKRPQIEADAGRLTEAVKRSVDRSSTLGRVALSRDLSANGVRDLAEQYDPEFGGFGFSPARPNRPKFPEPVNLVFLLDQDRRMGSRMAPSTAFSEPLTEVVKTLDRMARGGIRDHLAGGYHRYSTKRDWSVPHFEKMLYDNAQLATVHLLAFERTGDPRWRAEAEATFAFVARSLTGPEGGFYSALDAESEGEEGRTYVWTAEEVAKVLGKDGASVFGRVYGLDRPANFEKDRHVLLEPRPRSEIASELAMTPEVLEQKLVPLRKTLLDVRDRRPQPLRDDKVLTAWNGLTIAAYADGFRVLRNPAYRRAAERAADFLLTKLRDRDGRLLRTYRTGQAKLPAYLEDYAFLAHGLLRLHAATGDPKRLAQAKALADRMIADFGDAEHGGFYFTATDHESLLARAKDPLDGAVPAGNSVAIRALVALAKSTGDTHYLDVAAKALDAFSASLARNPAGSPLMLVALDEYLDARGGGAPPTITTAAPKSVTQGVVTATVGAVAVEPGKVVEIPITLAIRDGFHLYANDPGNEEVIATAVSLARVEGFALDDVAYPKGTSRTLEANGPEKMNLYENEVTIKARIKADAGLAPGRREVTLRVKYQACNDRSCLAPATLEVPVAVEVRGRR